MTDYIRRDALREARNLAIRAYENANVFNADAIRKRLKPLLDAVVDTPAADVAEVVRCKDCELWDSDPDTYGKDTGPEGKCMKSFERMPADGFCSYGERREEP